MWNLCKIVRERDLDQASARESVRPHRCDAAAECHRCQRAHVLERFFRDLRQIVRERDLDQAGATENKESHGSDAAVDCDGREALHPIEGPGRDAGELCRNVTAMEALNRCQTANYLKCFM